MAKSLTANISGANLALGIATLAFAANFSVWILYAVVGLNLQTELELNATELGFLFAAPMLTGALGRIPAPCSFSTAQTLNPPPEMIPMFFGLRMPQF